MPTRPVVRIALLSTVALAARPSSARAADDADNGAVAYRQAFAALPADKATVDKLGDWDTLAVDDAAAAALVDQFGPALDAVHRGSAAKSVDWGWDLSKGSALKLPELNGVRDLSGAAGFAVRYYAGQKQYDKAVAVADDLLLLARRSGGDKAYVARLTGFGAERVAARAVDAVLTQMPADAVGKWADDLRDAPPVPPLADTAKGEGECLTATITHPDPDDEAVKKLDLPADPAERAKLAGQVSSLWTDLAAIPDMKPREGKAALAALEEKVKAAPPAVAAVLPKPARTVAMEHAVTASSALNAAAAEVARSGKDAVAATKDPFGGKPFAYAEASGGGFTLTSRLTVNGKPVIVTVGPDALR